ncbi:multidrug ABC transporter ATP-binding protein, partial [Bermanella sp. 47_1433_sub80_T6]
MICVENLSKQFDDFLAVDNLSFTVAPGEVLGFLGPNGAGKSTTMKIISGFLGASQGVVTVCGINVYDAPQKVQELMGYLPEGAPAYGEMTVSAFLDFIAQVRGFKGAQKQQRLQAVVEQVQLQSVLGQVIDTLSKGFVRRVGIAQAIMHDPKVLILDEPTDGLDPNQKHQVRELIKGLAKDKIVIISTHILEEVSAVCTRALIIDQGKLIVDGKPSVLERQSRYHNAISLSLEDEIEGAQDMLQELPGIKAVEQINKRSFTLFPMDGAMLLTQLVRWLDEKAWQVENLHVEKG